VGVVTSPSGAAIRDVIEVSGRRFPTIPLLIAPSRVQGEGAEQEIAAALEAIGRVEDVEVILLVRGGGSLEDLLPFNTEVVARAIRATAVPVVSGVGHETDLTIADLAADVRAPTPSAAAAAALPDADASRARVARDGARLRAALRGTLAQLRARLGHEWQALRAHAPRARLATQRARLEAARAGLLRETRGRLQLARGRCGTAAARLESLSPLAVLARGYAIVWRREDGSVVRRPQQVAPGDALAIRVAEGEIEAAATGSDSSGASTKGRVR
jgi:exodeoxyribonuclease VII large subunit